MGNLTIFAQKAPVYTLAQAVPLKKNVIDKDTQTDVQRKLLPWFVKGKNWGKIKYLPVRDCLHKFSKLWVLSHLKRGRSLYTDTETHAWFLLCC